MHQRSQTTTQNKKVLLYWNCNVFPILQLIRIFIKLDHDIQLSIFGLFFANSSTVILNYSHGGVVSQSVAIAVAEALIKRYPEMDLGCIDLTDLFWTKSLSRRMSFEKRAAREEIELVFFHEIVRKVERYKIPHSLILNLDQTPTNFVPGSSRTQAQICSDCPNCRLDWQKNDNHSIYSDNEWPFFTHAADLWE